MPSDNHVLHDGANLVGNRLIFNAKFSLIKQSCVSFFILEICVFDGMYLKNWNRWLRWVSDKFVEKEVPWISYEALKQAVIDIGSCFPGQSYMFLV